METRMEEKPFITIIGKRILEIYRPINLDSKEDVEAVKKALKMSEYMVFPKKAKKL